MRDSSLRSLRNRSRPALGALAQHRHLSEVGAFLVRLADDLPVLHLRMVTLRRALRRALELSPKKGGAPAEGDWSLEKVVGEKVTEIMIV